LLAGGDRPDEFKQIFFVDSLVGLAPQLAALHRPWLGPFVGADHHLLFPGTANLKSAALVPLTRKDRATGALCFGSREPARFTRHHGTDFLAHLGAVAAVCIENAVNRARLLRAGITDFLTGWHNRRYLQQRLKEELARAQRRGGVIACLMIDIDRFKSINDGYGHLAGDNALKEIAHRVESQIRSMDTAARFVTLGPDECLRLLEQHHLGRLAVVVDGQPLAFRGGKSRSRSERHLDFLGRQALSRTFDTTPSRPSLQACSNISLHFVLWAKWPTSAASIPSRAAALSASVGDRHQRGGIQFRARIRLFPAVRFGPKSNLF
jgi:GGDEF domain-containing protein